MNFKFASGISLVRWQQEGTSQNGSRDWCLICRPMFLEFLKNWKQCHQSTSFGKEKNFGKFEYLIMSLTYKLRSCSKMPQNWPINSVSLLIAYLTWSRPYVPCVLTCSRVNVPCMLTCSRANLSCVLTCPRDLRAYVLYSNFKTVKFRPS